MVMSAQLPGGVLLLNAAVLLVHIVCPAYSVKGYVCNNAGEPLEYRLNGLACLLISVIMFLVVHSWAPEVTLSLSYNHMTCAILSNLLGLGLTFYLVYIRYPNLSPKEQEQNALRRAPTVGASGKGKRDDRGAAFFNGKEFNPRLLTMNTTVDVKMFLYIVGAVVLELNVLSAVLRERFESGGNSSSTAMLIYASCMTWFVCEYMYNERIHLYTYDLFAEKVGFKLAWGCLAFYPYFYPIGIMPMLFSENDINSMEAILIVMLFLLGWILTRGANLQKYWFRRFPSSNTCFGGLVKQTTLDGSNHKILCSGFWGLAQHVNYLGEIMQAVALAMPGVFVGSGKLRLLPLLYPLYYVALFIPRQWDDEVIMRQKYGDKVMDEYKAKVPYRIVPGVY